MVKKSSKNNKNIILILTLLIIIVTIFAPKIIDLTGKVASVSCTDTERTANIFELGYISGEDSTGKIYTNEPDFCSTINLNQLVDYYCDADGYVTPTTGNCADPYVCQNGACVMDTSVTRGASEETFSDYNAIQSDCTNKGGVLTTKGRVTGDEFCNSIQKTCLETYWLDNTGVESYYTSEGCDTTSSEKVCCSEGTAETREDKTTDTTVVVQYTCTPTCTALTPICDRGNCVECTTNTHCAADEACTTKTCVSTTPSTTYIKFTCDPVCTAPTPACYKYNTCVECRLDAHCIGDKVCNTNTNTCVEPPVCGDNKADAGEECDGGTGCTNCICDTGYKSTTPVSINCKLTTIITGAEACTPGKRLDVNNDGTSDNYCDSNANSVALLPDQDQCDASYKCQSNICAPNNKCLSYNYLKELYCSIKENILDETTDSDYQTHCT